MGIGSSSAEGLAAAVTLKMKKGQNTLSTWEYTKLMAKIMFLDLLLEWTNGHCGCVDLIEYIPFVNPKPSPLPAPPFAVTTSRKERGEGEEEKRREEKRREEKRRETRASLRRSSPFLSKNRLELLSSFRFLHLYGFSTLFIVVPHVWCSLEVVEGLR